MNQEKNRWLLDDKVKEKHLKTIKDYLQKSDEALKTSDLIDDLDLSGTELNPYTLGTLLESLGYKCTDRQDNGWQFDYWFTYEKEGHSNLMILGTGILFELNLSQRAAYE